MCETRRGVELKPGPRRSSVVTPEQFLSDLALDKVA